MHDHACPQYSKLVGLLKLAYWFGILIEFSWSIPGFHSLGSYLMILDRVDRGLKTCSAPLWCMWLLHHSFRVVYPLKSEDSVLMKRHGWVKRISKSVVDGSAVRAGFFLKKVIIVAMHVDKVLHCLMKAVWKSCLTNLWVQTVDNGFGVDYQLPYMITEDTYRL